MNVFSGTSATLILPTMAHFGSQSAYTQGAGV